MHLTTPPLQVWRLRLSIPWSRNRPHTNRRIQTRSPPSRSDKADKGTEPIPKITWNPSDPQAQEGQALSQWSGDAEPAWLTGCMTWRPSLWRQESDDSQKGGQGGDSRSQTDRQVLAAFIPTWEVALLYSHAIFVGLMRSWYILTQQVAGRIIQEIHNAGVTKPKQQQQRIGMRWWSEWDG